MSNPISKAEFYTALAELADGIHKGVKLGGLGFGALAATFRARANEENPVETRNAVPAESTSLVDTVKLNIERQNAAMSSAPMPIVRPAFTSEEGAPNDPKPVMRKGDAVTAPTNLRTLVEGVLTDGAGNYAIRMSRRGPGDVVVSLVINDNVAATIPFDNLVKANVRLDPDHVSEAQRQVAEAREEMAKARATAIDWEAKSRSLEKELAATNARHEDAMRAAQTFSNTFKAPRCPGDCSRGGDGPACGLPGCRG